MYRNIVQYNMFRASTSHAPKDKQGTIPKTVPAVDSILKMAPAVFDIEGAGTSLQLPEQNKESIRDSQDIHSRYVYITVTMPSNW